MIAFHEGNSILNHVKRPLLAGHAIQDLDDFRLILLEDVGMIPFGQIVAERGLLIGHRLEPRVDLRHRLLLRLLQMPRRDVVVIRERGQRLRRGRCGRGPASGGFDDRLQHRGRVSRRFPPEVLGNRVVVRVPVLRSHHTVGRSGVGRRPSRGC